ncbi:MAG TPA: hypothetical protein PKM27_09490 [Saprospiraceae bacterium]|nr:hypothetical protein [Saprospiraceae bacterium]HNT21430.1 hypothetical protein [Saprospiraceae bacterium]
MLKKYFSFNHWIVLGIIILVELIVNLLLKATLLTEKVLYNSLVEKMTLEDISSFSSTVRSSAWMLVVFGVAQRIGEILLISVCISIGTLLFRYDIQFRQILKVVILSFLVFTVSRLPLLITLLSGKVEKFEDLSFMPNLSLADWFRPENLPEWGLYPLQLINVYQFLFILLMAAGFNRIDPRGIPKWLGLILLTYGTGLAITVVLTAFATAI